MKTNFVNRKKNSMDFHSLWKMKNMTVLMKYIKNLYCSYESLRIILQRKESCRMRTEWMSWHWTMDFSGFFSLKFVDVKFYWKLNRIAQRKDSMTISFCLDSQCTCDIKRQHGQEKQEIYVQELLTNEFFYSFFLKMISDGTNKGKTCPKSMKITNCTWPMYVNLNFL